MVLGINLWTRSICRAGVESTFWRRFPFFLSSFANADRDRTGVEVRALRIDQIQRLSIRRLAHSVIGIRRYVQREHQKRRCHLANGMKNTRHGCTRYGALVDESPSTDICPYVGFDLVGSWTGRFEGSQPQRSIIKIVATTRTVRNHSGSSSTALQLSFSLV